MELLQFIPWLLIILAAFWVVSLTRSSGLKPSKAKLAGLWLFAVIVPLIIEVGVVNTFFPNSLALTSLHWYLMHHFGMELNESEYVVDTLWHVTGALVGICVVLIARAICYPKQTKSH